MKKYVYLMLFVLCGCVASLRDAHTLVYYSPLDPTTPHAETLNHYFPIDPATPPSGWRLVNYRSYRAGAPKEVRTITDQPGLTSSSEEYLWFGVPTKSERKKWNLERYRRCGNWLWFDAFIALQRKEEQRPMHPVVATRILLTRNGQTTNFLLSDEYKQCARNTIGHPYLPWNVDTTYRLQIWGTLANETTARWYWDVIFRPPATIYNPCWPGPKKKRTTIGVTEAWWMRKPGMKVGAWKMGDGEIMNGVPSGVMTRYGRTTYHAEGPIPYWLTTSPSTGSINACIDAEWPVTAVTSSSQTSFKTPHL